MPKILINEVDNTSAGTPGSYGNYAVLLTGYAYRTAILTKDATDSSPADKIQPDENGVYEFSSKQDFLDTIGQLDPITNETNYGPDWDILKKGSIVKSGTTTTTTATEYHYGYRMAKELLSLGYTVIYKVINSVVEMNDENFWAIFKDKASYDFRFISHGLLETCYDQTQHARYYNRLIEIEEALGKLAELEKMLNNGEVISFEEFSKLAPEKKQAYEDKYTELNYAFSDNAGVITGTSDTGLTYASYSTAKESLAGDKLEVQNAIKTHNATEFTIDVFNEINGHIAKLAAYKASDTSTIPGRGDCTALIELDEDCYCEATVGKRPEQLIIEGIENMAGTIDSTANGTYCALTVPSVFYKMNNSSVKFPGAFHYLACFMSSLRLGYAEWYAAAGYTRGVSSYVIDHTSVKLGEIAINALEPRSKVTDGPTFACNVIANFRGSYYLWGNRTAAQLASADSQSGDLTAKHFLNIRQLCSTIKKQLYVSCRRFTFDPNSDALWINFVNSIKPTLEAMKADQGIRDYQVVKEFTDKKATLKARIRIIPIEAVEDFDLTVSLEDSFGGVSVTTEG